MSADTAPSQARKPGYRRITLPDGSRVTVRAVTQDGVVVALRATTGDEPGKDYCIPVSVGGDAGAAFEALRTRVLVQWNTTVPARAPPLTYAEALALATANEATAAGLEAEARELRAQGQEALRRALA
jgi:hypothetical protein